jgi:hypothetical protein
VARRVLDKIVAATVFGGGDLKVSCFNGGKIVVIGFD